MCGKSVMMLQTQNMGLVKHIATLKQMYGGAATRSNVIVVKQFVCWLVA